MEQINPALSLGSEEMYYCLDIIREGWFFKGDDREEHFAVLEELVPDEGVRWQLFGIVAQEMEVSGVINTRDDARVTASDEETAMLPKTGLVQEARLPAMSARELVMALQRMPQVEQLAGSVGHRSHAFLSNITGEIIRLKVRNDSFGTSYLKNILKRAGVTPAEFLHYL